MSDENAPLLARIHSAFADVPPPPDDRLVSDGGSYLEGDAIRQAFRGRRWHEVPLDDLRREVAALYFFTPEAFRYYLPAFLAAAVADPARSDTIPGSLIRALSKPDAPGDDLRWFEDRAGGFTDAQSAAIRAFLESRVKHFAGSDPFGDAEAALKSYWIEHG